MTKRIFTDAEMEKLSQNSNVRKVSERSIAYDKNFKLRAVERYRDDVALQNRILRAIGV